MTNTSCSTSPLVTWDELLESISTGAAHPDETNWKIFRYLQSNYKTMGSQIARTLLAAYIKLHVKRESLINSCMLGMAVKISEMYAGAMTIACVQVICDGRRERTADNISRLRSVSTKPCGRICFIIQKSAMASAMAL